MKNFIKILSIIFTLFSLYILSPIYIQAQFPSGASQQQIQNWYSQTYQGNTQNSVTSDIGGQIENLGLFNSNIGFYIVKIIDAALILASVAALIFLIMGAIQWITSGGDKNQNEGAKNRITAALMGLAVMASVWVIWLLVLYFLGLNRIPNFNVTGLSGGGGSRSSGSATTNAGSATSDTNTRQALLCGQGWCVDTTTGECNGGSCDAALRQYGANPSHSQQAGDMYVNLNNLYKQNGW